MLNVTEKKNIKKSAIVFYLIFILGELVLIAHWVLSVFIIKITTFRLTRCYLNSIYAIGSEFEECRQRHLPWIWFDYTIWPLILVGILLTIIIMIRSTYKAFKSNDYSLYEDTDSNKKNTAD